MSKLQQRAKEAYKESYNHECLVQERTAAHLVTVCIQLLLENKLSLWKCENFKSGACDKNNGDISDNMKKNHTFFKQSKMIGSLLLLLKTGMAKLWLPKCCWLSLTIGCAVWD